MTKRKMADRKVLQLLYLLYDVCKDCLEELFKYNCLQDDHTDDKLTKYVMDHKIQLYHHMKYSCCHTCANNQNSCAKDNLETEQHKWIRTLYKKRHELSLHFDTISDANFDRIWIETRDIILNILRTLDNRQYEKAVVKQLSLLKMTGPELCGNEEYWCMMREEFNVEVRPHPDKILSTPAVKREIEAMFESHERVLLEKIGQMYVVANVKHATKTYDETIKEDIHNDGKETDLGQGATSSSCAAKDRQDYRAVWTIKTDDDTDKEKLEEIAKYIEQTKVIDENITIEYVHIGSIIIGTLIAANAVENSDLFNQTVRRFIRMIIKKCSFNTNFEHVLEVDVTLTPSLEYQGIEDTEISVDEERLAVTTPSLEVKKSHEKCTQTNDSEIRLEKGEW
ncbi:unnamed protein product [Mytilus edulis]|uniref:Uncharacterized protein n=1 Tax=Mytilus edulis TaxID=6550 RepID=A0A8S3QID6_MYTED|nr:unnamed protein product [Mytilus edulis]